VMLARRSMASAALLLLCAAALESIADAPLINSERFIEIAIQAALNEYPQLDRDDITLSTETFMVVCRQGFSCAAFLNFERVGEPGKTQDSEAELIKVRVSEEGSATVYRPGRPAGGIVHDPSR